MAALVWGLLLSATAPALASKVVIGAARSLEKSDINMQAEDLMFVEMEEPNHFGLNLLIAVIIIVVFGLLIFVMMAEKSEEELQGFTGEAVLREIRDRKYGLDVDFSKIIQDGKIGAPKTGKELDNLPSAPPAATKKPSKQRKPGDQTKKRN